MRRGILSTLHSMPFDVAWLLDIGHAPATCGVELEASFPNHSYPRDSIKIKVSTYSVPISVQQRSLHKAKYQLYIISL